MSQKKKSAQRGAATGTAPRSTRPIPWERNGRPAAGRSDPNRRTITFGIIVGGIVLAVLVLLAGYERGSAPPAASQQSSGSLDAATVAALQDRVNQNPNDVLSLVGLGNAYYDAQRYVDAIPWYEKALQISPTDTNVRTDLGTSYFYSGDSDKAKEQWFKVLEQDPNKIQTHYNLAVLYNHQSPPDMDLAAKEWETVIKIDPNSPQAKDAERNLKSIGKR